MWCIFILLLEMVNLGNWYIGKLSMINFYVNEKKFKELVYD